MHLTLSRCGGVAGVRTPPVTIDTRSLPRARALRVEALIAGADFFQLPAVIAAKERQPDCFQYTLTITDDAGATHAVTLDEEAAPGPLLDLIRLVQRAARE